MTFPLATWVSYTSPMRSLAIALSLCVFAVPASAADPVRGAEIFAMAGGCGCHSAEDGPMGAGGGEVPTPFGTFYGTNLTSDPIHGLGAWSDDEIEAAIRRGIRRDGSSESPAMPYYRYAGMADRDVADLIAYLRSLPAVARANREHEVALPFARWGYRFWRTAFAPSVTPAAEAPSETLARGRYLADHVAICGDCHTPRNLLGVPREDLYLAGTEDGPGGADAPNLTPHATGLAEWSADDMLTLLQLGMLPNFDNVQGWMAHVIDGRGDGPGYADAPEADLKAIAAYVLSLPPIEHRVGD